MSDRSRHASPEDARRALAALVEEAKAHLDVPRSERSPRSVRPPRSVRSVDHAGSAETASRDTAADESGSSAELASQPKLAAIDWERLEARVMASVAHEPVAPARHLAQTTRSRDIAARGFVALLAAAAAAAAVALVYVRREPLDPAGDPAHVSASALQLTEGSGVIRIGDAVARAGDVVRAGDSIAAVGARAIFERPNKVTWALEQSGSEPVPRVRVKSAEASLVLALDDGAVEAQVVPVTSGEAFAVDIATEAGLVRVAVHGTHLRVARTGSHVVVDLSEGVVAIGAPPREGITTGTTVTAPAHVELDARDLGTLRIDHDPASVRAPLTLGRTAQAPVTAPPLAAAAPPTLQVEPARPSTSASAGVASPAFAPQPIRTAMAPSRSVDDPPSPVTPPVPPREAIVAAVRECAAARNRSGSVAVTVSSDLRLRVSSSGTIESAQFVPPLPADVQTCAASRIYAIRMEDTGPVTIPIELSY